MAFSALYPSLRRFAAHHRVPGLYHETITWAYLLLIRERMQRDGAPQDWPSFRDATLVSIRGMYPRIRETALVTRSSGFT